MNDRSRPKAAPETPAKVSTDKATAPKGLPLAAARCWLCDGVDAHDADCPKGRDIAAARHRDEVWFQKHPGQSARQRVIAAGEASQVAQATGRRPRRAVLVVNGRGGIVVVVRLKRAVAR